MRPEGMGPSEWRAVERAIEIFHLWGVRARTT
jgi:hypothetical protein